MKKDTAEAIVKALARVASQDDEPIEPGMSPLMWDEEKAWTLVLRARAYLKSTKPKRTNTHPAKRQG